MCVVAYLNLGIVYSAVGMKAAAEKVIFPHQYYAVFRHLCFSESVLSVGCNHGRNYWGSGSPDLPKIWTDPQLFT